MPAPRGVGAKRLFRADLHVHSARSGAGHFRSRVLPGAADGPLALYRAARSRGLDLVALTDVDTLDGCLQVLERHPDASDLLMAVEVTARDPRGRRSLPVLLYDVDEARHREAQRLKADVRDLAAWARREGILASLGACPDLLPGRSGAASDLRELLPLFDLFELRNGLAARGHNELFARLVHEGRGRPFGITAGSGAHTGAAVGRTMTVSRARTRAEFLADLRHGRTWAAGRDGTLRSAAGEIVRMLGGRLRAAEEPRARGARGRARGLLPLALAGAPVVAHGLVRARHAARVRRVRRRLDRMEMTRFQEKARAYETAAAAAGPAAGDGR
jgi:predicted metal-dependent phosphoesterase TrpH